MKPRPLRHRMRHRGRGQGLILLYHRVTTLDLDPQLLCVTPERFAEHLDVLRKLTAVVPLERIREASDAGNAVRAAVTFDDGYADNFTVASPLLRTADVPATFFVVTGLVGFDREFWWDRVEHALLVLDDLPLVLELTIDGDVLHLDTSGISPRHKAWNVQSESTPSARHDAYRTLMTRLRPLETPSRDAAIDELHRWAGISDGARNTHRVLDDSELSRLDAHELASVGAHTVSHPLLAVLHPEQQRDEVDGSKRRLEELLGRRVTSFAYPFGGRDAYSQTTIGIVANSGFELACANIEGRVGRRTPPFEVPRFLVRDWDGDEFERRLRMWAEL